ncbi:MAG: tRNA-guanine transglycosylase [Thermoprotei archaeon ex4572_64]|nr:MAG: tRNA-guanine transglycosylase [Thermoprotei archaeon ex4572_64]
MFEILDKCLAGRVGKLYTKSGVIETPALFPVINPLRQIVPLSEIEKIGYRQVITNAYLVMKNFRDLAVELKIHNILDWRNVIMTDSGAYQLMEYGFIDIDPDDILKYQIDIETDIAVILDIPSRVDTSRIKIINDVEETLRRARRALEYLKIIDPNHKTLIVGPIQGGINFDILQYSARCMSKLDFDIYAIGSPTTLLEEYDFRSIIKMIITAKSYLPLGKPIHLFGAGHPLIMPLSVALGVDLFDTASYALYARDDRLIMRDRTVRLNELSTEYIPCSCPTCSKYSVKELKELSKQEREKLIAIHNLYALHREIEEVKQRIKEGTLWNYIEEKACSCSKLQNALIELKLFSKIFKKIDLETRGKVHGLEIITEIDRPECERYVEKLISNYVPPPKKVLLIIEEFKERPYTRNVLFRTLTEKLRRMNILSHVHIAFLNPILGIIPHELSEVYPVSQHEYSELVFEKYLERNIDVLRRYLLKTNYEIVIFLVSDRYLKSKSIFRIGYKRILIIKIGEIESLYSIADWLALLIKRVIYSMEGHLPSSQELS